MKGVPISSHMVQPQVYCLWWVSNKNDSFSELFGIGTDCSQVRYSPVISQPPHSEEFQLTVITNQDQGHHIHVQTHIHTPVFFPKNKPTQNLHLTFRKLYS